MGAWGHGPFDNDTAADFAHDLRQCSTLPAPLPARTALLLDTMRQVLNGEDQPSDYGLDYRVERAVAAVAYVADACARRCHHTDSAFARGVQDDGDLYPPVVLEPVTAELHATALALLDWIGQRLITDDAGTAFAQELNLLRDDLNRYQPAAAAGQ